MMENIRKAFREEVANLTWIDDETRPKVYEKVQAAFKFFFFFPPLYIKDKSRPLTDVITSKTKSTWREI